MKLILSLSLLMPFMSYASPQDFSYIDCFKLQSRFSSLAYRIQIDGTDLRTVYRDVLDPIVKVDFEEQPSGNSGSYLASEEGGEARFKLCRVQRRVFNNLIPIRAFDSVRGNRIVYCQSSILNYVDGFQADCK